MREMGFGSLLEMRIKSVPTKMSYWVLEHFNSDRCELHLDAGRGFHVVEDDVWFS